MDLDKLKTIEGETIQVISAGIHNHDSGPDFLNAKISIDDQIWVGTVEIHLNSSDWYWHQHEIDKNYDAVILHVVWDHDVDVFMRNDQPLPTLELKDIVSKDLLNNYKALSKNSQKWIPCEDQLKDFDEFLLKAWLERLYVERLERKSILIRELLADNNNDWDATLFCLLAKNFGLNKNGDSFFELARSVPFSIVRKCSKDCLQLEALFFGQAGFLQKETDGTYFEKLRVEYDFLRQKHGLRPLSNQLFQFFRMRPSNFPTIRIAQLAALLFESEGLFSSLIRVNEIKEIYNLFNLKLNEFWQTHYTFNKPSKRSAKKLSRSFLDLVLINTIIPIKFTYARACDQHIEEELIELLSQLKYENNAIVNGFIRLGIPVNNSFDSQSLLELKNNYCAPKRCLECAIGNKLLRS